MNEKTSKADLMTSSILLSRAETAELIAKSKMDNQKGESICLTSGREFHLITRNGPSQFMVAALLKGILPVADVVPVFDHEQRNYKYFSYYTPMSAVREKMDEKDFVAGIYILCFVFRDCDHGAYLDRQGKIQYSNMMVNPEMEVGYFYDFHFSSPEFWEAEIEENVSILRKIHERTKDLDPDTKVKLIDKINKLCVQLEGEKGLHFMSNILGKTRKYFGQLFPKRSDLMKVKLRSLLFGDTEDVIIFRDTIQKRARYLKKMLE